MVYRIFGVVLAVGLVAIAGVQSIATIGRASANPSANESGTRAAAEKGGVHAGKPFVIEHRGLCCDKTTEAGADEVYILVAAKGPGAKSYGERLPADAPHEARGHWDMNDGKQPTDNPSGDSHCIGSKEKPRVLFRGELAPGESMVVTLFIMEEDLGPQGKPLGNYVRQAGEAIDIVGVKEAAQFIAKVFDLAGLKVDSDDYIGSIQARVSRGADSSLSVIWQPLERVKNSGPDPEDKGNSARCETRFNGDGSNYICWMRVRE